MGSVHELLSGKSEFARDLRRDFLDFQNEEQAPGIPVDRYDDFLNFLREWGC